MKSISSIRGYTIADIKSRQELQLLHSKVGYAINIDELGAKKDDPEFDNTRIIQYAFDNFTNIIINGSYYTNSLTITNNIILDGDCTLIIKDEDQEYGLLIKSRITVNGKLKLDGSDKCYYGIILNGARNSIFNIVVSCHNKLSGIKSVSKSKSATRDNSMVTFRNLITYNNGLVHRATGTITSENKTNEDERCAYLTFENELPYFESAYAIDYNNLIYKAESDTLYSIACYHLDNGVDSMCEVDVLYGAGFETIQDGSDSIYIENFETYNNTIGYVTDKQNSLCINNLRSTDNTIGFFVHGNCNNMTLPSPYFKNNIIDFACWESCKCVITEPNQFEISNLMKGTKFIDGMIMLRDGELEKDLVEVHPINDSKNNITIDDDKLHVMYFTGSKIRTIKLVKSKDTDVKKEILLYTNQTSSITFNFVCESGYTITMSSLNMSDVTKIDFVLYNKMWIVKKY